MRRILIHGLSIQESSKDYFYRILHYLKDHNCEVFLSRQFIDRNRAIIPEGYTQLTTVDPSVSAVFSLGGDGTFLESVLLVGKYEIPILGINMGRLGFLASVSKEFLAESLKLFFKDQFSVEPRTMITVTSPEKIFDKKAFALNECAILRRDTSSMMKVKSYINNHYLNTYWADGLMVSTPTGSTGYSLSCGGPLMMPDSKDFVITPISPHNLNVRPLIVSDDSELRFQIESRSNHYLVSLDSRSESIAGNQEIVLRKAAFKAMLIRIEGFSFPDTIRNKLSWGLDKRN